MTVSPEQFVERLQAISEQDGLSYGRANLVLEKENEHSRATLEYKGFLALSNAFKCFFLETVELLNTEVQARTHGPLSDSYALFIPRLSHSFQSLCGAERIAISGYPYHGYVLLRNVFDSVLMTSAALQSITDFYSIEGIDPAIPFSEDAMRKLRKKTEFAVQRMMTGDSSGLSQRTMAELQRWDRLFDYETHGARLSLTQAMGWLANAAPLFVLPKFDEMAFAMFMNRFCEVGWMTHRLIPIVQPPDLPFSKEWKNKWRVVDSSFEQSVDSLTRQLGKDIGQAIVEFVSAKFPFTEDSKFPL